MFLATSAMYVVVKNRKNDAKILSKTAFKSTPQLASIWEPTWLHFGGVWGSKLGPSWHQIVPKIDLKTDHKNDHLSDRSWNRF